LGAVCSDGRVMDAQSRPLGYRLWQAHHFTKAERTRARQEGALAVLLQHNVVTGATLLFRARFRPLVLPIPPGQPLIHDGWIALLIAAVAGVDFLPDPLICYRRHSMQQMGAAPPLRLGWRDLLSRARQAQAGAYL